MDWKEVIIVLRTRANVAQSNAYHNIGDEILHNVLKSESRTLENLADALEAGITPDKVDGTD